MSICGTGALGLRFIMLRELRNIHAIWYGRAGDGKTQASRCGEAKRIELDELNYLRAVGKTLVESWKQ